VAVVVAYVRRPSCGWKVNLTPVEYVDGRAPKAVQK